MKEYWKKRYRELYVPDCGDDDVCQRFWDDNVDFISSVFALQKKEILETKEKEIYKNVYGNIKFEVEEELLGKIHILIIQEMLICHKENQPTSRLTSLSNAIKKQLPDRICGEGPLSPCEYRKDGKPINIANDYVEKLQQDPAFRQKEKEVEQTQKQGKSIRKLTPKEL